MGLAPGLESREWNIINATITCASFDKYAFSLNVSGGRHLFSLMLNVKLLCIETMVTVVSARSTVELFTSQCRSEVDGFYKSMRPVLFSMFAWWVMEAMMPSNE